MADRIPPHNVDAERYLLSAFVFNPVEGAKLCLGLIEPRDFYKPAHAHIFEVLTECVETGVKPDPVTVVATLEEKGLLDACGGREGVVEACFELASTTGNIPRYAEVITGHARNRDLIHAAGEIAEMGYERADPAKNAAAAMELIQRIVDDTNKRVRLRTMDEMLDDYMAVLEKREQGEGLGIATGWHDLDNLIQGLREGQLAVVGAPPKTGKSTFAGNLALNVVKEGYRVLLVSVEMAETEIMERLMAAEAKVNLTRLRAGQLENEHWGKIGDAAARLSGKQLFILDDPLCSMAEVRACAMRVSADLVIIDYTQLMKAEVHRGGTREQVVAELTASMKRMARELRLPVVALSQVKREAADGRPGLTDFAESSSFEKNADLLIGLYREGAQDDHAIDKGIIEVIVIASRSTKTGTVRLAYLGHHQRIAAMAQAAPPRPRYNN